MMNFGGHDRAWVWPAVWWMAFTIIALVATAAGFFALSVYQHFQG